MADIFVEKVRESEKAALATKRQAQLDAKELIDTAKSNGEKRLVLAERDAGALLASTAKNDAAYAEKLLQKEDANADRDAEALIASASSRMDEAVALILQRVGGVWQ